jgi:hypothetical protein
MGLKGPQIVSLPGAHTFLGPAVRTPIKIIIIIIIIIIMS